MAAVGVAESRVGSSFAEELAGVLEVERLRLSLARAVSDAEREALDRITRACSDVNGPEVGRYDQAAGVLRLLRDQGVFDRLGRRR